MMKRGSVSLYALCVLAGAASAADLPRYGRPAPLYHRHDVPNLDTPPTSTHGYYGYYGVDIAGVPYNGTYSEDVICLRSVKTEFGYRTIDACR